MDSIPVVFYALFRGNSRKNYMGNSVFYLINRQFIPYGLKLAVYKTV